MATFGMVMSFLLLSSNGDTERTQATLLQVSRKEFEKLCYGDSFVNKDQVQKICEHYNITDEQYAFLCRIMNGESSLWISNLPGTPQAQAVRQLLVRGISPQDIAKTVNMSIAYLWATCLGIKPEIFGFYDTLNARYRIHVESENNCVYMDGCTLQQRALLWMISHSFNNLRKDSLNKMNAILESVEPDANPKPARRATSPIKMFLQSRSGMPLEAFADRMAQETEGEEYDFRGACIRQGNFSKPELSAVSRFLDLSEIDAICLDYCNKLSEESICLPVSAILVTVQQKQLVSLLQEKLPFLTTDTCESLFQIITNAYSTSVGDVQGRRMIRSYLGHEKGGIVGLFLRDLYIGEVPTAEKFSRMLGVHQSSAGRILRGEADVTYDMFRTLSKSCFCSELDHELLRYACYLNRRRILLDMYGSNTQQKLIAEQFQTTLLELNPDEIYDIRQILDKAEHRRFHEVGQI